MSDRARTEKLSFLMNQKPHRDLKDIFELIGSRATTFMIGVCLENAILILIFRSECWYLPLKTALEAVGDENRPKFFKANFNP